MTVDPSLERERRFTAPLPPRVLIAEDAKMPRLDGVETARRILAERPAPIVLLRRPDGSLGVALDPEQLR